MKINQILNEDGRIVPGVNTTVDVKPGETERQAAKFFGYNKNLLKKRNAKDPIHTLYNLGLVNESAELTWEKVVKQSDPITVLNKVMDRRDNSAFPVRMYDGSTIGVTPNTAKRIIDVYDNLEDEKKKKVEWYLRTKNGFKELAQLVGAIAKPTVARVSGALTDHVEEAWSQSYKKSIDCSNPKGFSQKAHCAGRKKSKKENINHVSTKTNITTRRDNTGRYKNTSQHSRISNAQGTSDLYKTSATTPQGKSSFKSLVRPDGSYTNTRRNADGTRSKTRGYDSIFKHRASTLNMSNK